MLITATDKAPLCACGCGKKTQYLPAKKTWDVFARCHRARPLGQAPLCACGCGNHVKGSQGSRWNTWLKGHHVRRHGFDPKESRRNEYMLRTYGISRKQYDLICKAQGDMCAICATSCKGSVVGTKLRTLWCIDHDHTTGNIRGLLCHRCNTALGLFKDDARILRKAIAYIEIDQ